MNKQNKPTDKLTDKAFSRLMLISVISILVCIVCLCSATWAWFSTDISNASNTLSSGNLGLIVTVTDQNGVPIDVSAGAKGASVCNLSAAGEYTVTLKTTDDTTVTNGFCVIKTENNSYQTAAMNIDGITSFEFTLIAEADITVTFCPAWGRPANPVVQLNDVLRVES